MLDFIEVVLEGGLLLLSLVVSHLGLHLLDVVCLRLAPLGLPLALR